MMFNNAVAVAEDYTNLKITEISYHPKDVINGTDTTDGKDLEFIEFKNIGNVAITLTGLVLDSAVYYEFPNDVQLGPGQFWVVASKPSKFLAYYGVEPSGNFSGNLANSGDEILLKDASDNEVIHFIFDDKAPWPEEADGDGYTLVSTYFNPTGNPADEAYWRASIKLYGSPFKDDGTTDISDNSALSNVLDVYPNPTSENVVIRVNDENFEKNLILNIYDISGSLIMQKVFSEETTVNLINEGLYSGVYMLRIESNSSVVTKRLIFTKP